MSDFLVLWAIWSHHYCGRSGWPKLLGAKFRHHMELSRDMYISCSDWILGACKLRGDLYWRPSKTVVIKEIITYSAGSFSNIFPGILLTRLSTNCLGWAVWSRDGRWVLCSAATYCVHGLVSRCLSCYSRLCVMGGTIDPGSRVVHAVCRYCRCRGCVLGGDTAPTSLAAYRTYMFSLIQHLQAYATFSTY